MKSKRLLEVEKILLLLKKLEKDLRSKIVLKNSRSYFCSLSSPSLKRRELHRKMSKPLITYNISLSLYNKNIKFSK